MFPSFIRETMWITFLGDTNMLSYLVFTMTLQFNKDISKYFTKMVEKQTYTLDDFQYKVEFKFKKIKDPKCSNPLCKFIADIQVTNVLVRRRMIDPVTSLCLRDERGNMMFEYVPTTKPPRHRVNGVNRDIRYKAMKELYSPAQFFNIHNWRLKIGNIVWDR